MPRKPDTPCAGRCGRMLWGGSTSLPSGQRICRKCRQQQSPAKTCAECGNALHFSKHPQGVAVCGACRKAGKPTSTAITCSGCGNRMHRGKETRTDGTAMCQPCRRARPGYAPDKPKRENPWRIVPCHCGVIFETDHPTKRYCQPRCRPSTRWGSGTRKSRTEPRSKGRTGRPWRRVRAQVIAEESHCWLCGFEADKGLRYPDPMSASVDHVVPISEGGDPLERSNLRLAHLTCNNRRSSRP